MKLSAIYNVWSDSIELLEGSIKQIRPFVDDVIVISQTHSNTNEYDNEAYNKCYDLYEAKIIDDMYFYNPVLNRTPQYNETAKRQLGLEIAKERNNTHYLFMDSDEYYIPEEFEFAKKTIEQGNIKASVIELYTYFGKPTLRLKEKERYYVPFICELFDGIKAGTGKYPYWCDPTRKTNHNPKDVKLIKDMINMHHFSYIRKDIAKKMRNSSAYNNIKHLIDITVKECETAHVGMKPSIYPDHELIEVSNQFNINIL